MQKTLWKEGTKRAGSWSTSRGRLPIDVSASDVGRQDVLQDAFVLVSFGPARDLSDNNHPIARGCTMSFCPEDQ
jgi:hypothetical protein